MALLVNKETSERALAFFKEVEGYGGKAIVSNSIDIACAWLGFDVNVVRNHLQVLQVQSGQTDSPLVRQSTQRGSPLKSKFSGGAYA